MRRRSSLDEYQKMRRFAETPEPVGGSRPASGTAKFVVQKHDATRLHYDFRLEVGGVLKSWAVPKGPSMDPRHKRLAMQVEDHPLEYAAFEGVIPEGNYGAGPVIVWDAGLFENLTRDKRGSQVPMSKALAQGHATFRLHGEKLRGAFALTRVASGDKPRWILVKMRDDEANERTEVTAKRPESVQSGRTIEEIAGGPTRATGRRAKAAPARPSGSSARRRVR